MNDILSFFLKYLLAPLIIVVAGFLCPLLAKGKVAIKKIIVFVLLSSLLLVLPSVLGLLGYEFIWGGLLISIGYYLLMGIVFNAFSHTTTFKKMGFDKDKPLLALTLFIILVLSAWLYYLVFSWLNNLGFAIWAMLSVCWFLVPIFYVISRNAFLAIPTPFYRPWTLEKEQNDQEYWNNVDMYRVMQVTVKIKRTPNTNEDSSFSVKLPKDVTLGKWFKRFIDDQNRRFPEKDIELEDNTGEPYGWMIYTSKWLPVPLFTRTLDLKENVDHNEIKNKAVLYIRRTAMNRNEPIKRSEP